MKDLFGNEVMSTTGGSYSYQCTALDKLRIEYNKYPDLVWYGIQDEDSHFRAHMTKDKVFIFYTGDAQKLLERTDLKIGTATQPDWPEPTGLGILCPWGKPRKEPCVFKRKRNGRDIFWVKDVKRWQSKRPFNELWGTSKKGRYALACIKHLVVNGRFPLPDSPQKTTLKEEIAGSDIKLHSNDQKIQIKCDWPASRTGNLYLQTAEFNPFKHK